MNNSSNIKIWLSSPHMSGKEMGYIEDAFKSNWIAPAGPHIDAFERELCTYNSVGHSAVLSSGTAALHLSLLLLDVGPDDYVLTQSLTFVASANPIKYLGATPVFIDSEASTWNMCPEHLEMAILDCLKGNINTKSGKGPSKLPKAIIPVHLFGMPANMEEILKVANKYGIPVVEDAAESLGSTYKRKACGTFGDMGVFSFNGNKIITTSSGGALVSHQEQFITKAKFLSTQAKEAAVYYQHEEIGYNYRMSNVLAGIGLAQLEVLDARIWARRNNFEHYRSFFQQVEGVNILEEPSADYFSNRWLTTIMVYPELNGGITNGDIMEALAKENIESRPVWKPMHLQPLYRGCSFYGQGVSEEIFDKGLCLPSGSNLSLIELNRITQVLEEVLTKRKAADKVRIAS
ncbi:pyridoxal phosphate-dependent aminotransferase [Pedobacter sp. HMWF019]|uniref:DegT/DnrJ/EryC1/StrS family aminotransferase n=1 Tax=Pedobacter sp. HMWF019 TaxID=2056856 RepID=UPI000D3357E7|nr:DegT/DnrJ/EryC1/StrS family aminotransferase [Pedobacter sp. HMWF019]PTT04042.1 pyridoxal phosphate-dependent aminotransferase [Pedobacter sp. HMWF019]